MRLTVFLLLSFSFSLARAESTLSGDAFDAFTKGHTLFYSQNGKIYGAESYFENARVRWSFLDGNCIFGQWYQEGELICFDYGSDLAVQCWRFFKGENGLVAQFDGDDDSLTEGSDGSVEGVMMTREAKARRRRGGEDY